MSSGGKQIAAQDEECNFLFRELENELRDAVDRDERRARENAAKFKALNQNVATYDEFKQIVDAAHLKAIDKSDKSRRPRTIWNSFSSSKRKKMTDEVTVAPVTHELRMQALQTKIGSPKSGHEFVNIWRRIGTADDQRYTLLKSLQDRNRLPALLTSEACFGLLGDLLRVLGQHEDTTDDFAFVVRTLELLARTRRFALSLQFLGAEERRECRALFQRLRTEMREKLQDLAEMHAITEWTLQELQHKYEFNLTTTRKSSSDYCDLYAV